MTKDLVTYMKFLFEFQKMEYFVTIEIYALRNISLPYFYSIRQSLVRCILVKAIIIL